MSQVHRNNLLTLPLPRKAISSNIDDRTLHELYSWPFAEAIRAGVGAVMTSYNDVNGSASSQNSMMINGILKDEFGFQGLVREYRISQSLWTMLSLIRL
jgi:beta-glucosidase-like glycosyl hydrolase